MSTVINKVEYYGTVLIDLTGDTVTSDKVVNGITTHDRTGAQITGSLVVQKYYTGQSDPTASIGDDGDLYLKVGS